MLSILLNTVATFIEATKVLSSFLFYFLLIVLAVLIISAIVFYRANTQLRKSQKIVKEKEERFKKLSNLTFEGILIHNNGYLIDSNEAFLEMFGYKLEELQGINLVEKLVHPEDRHIVQKNVRDQRTAPYEVRGFKKNGEEIPLEIESRDVSIDGEDVRVAALRDISERKKQQSLIEREEWLFQTLMSNIPDSIYFKDRESRFIRVNKNTARKFGVDNVTELVGKTDFDFFDEEHAKSAYEDEQRIMNTGQPIIGKIELETWKNGKKNWASTTKLPLLNSDNEVEGTFGISRDITQLKEAEETAKAEKEKFELLFRIVPSGVFTVNTEKEITSWNKMAEQLTGYSESEIIGQSCELYAEAPCNEMCGLFNKEYAKPIVNAECTLRKKNGELITVSKNVDLIRDENNEIIGGVESFIDISQRKRFEEKIKLMNKELEEINRSKDRFFSIIAHDLRNPFVTLLGFTEMMIEDYEDLTDQEKLNFLKEMNKTSQSSYELLDNLLQWSRAQTGRIKFEPEKVHFNKALQSNFELVQKTAELKKIDLVSKLNKDIFIQADADMVTTIMRNLITNAIKFTKKGGTITVDAEEGNDLVTISVSDTGIGIPPERVEKILRIDQTSSTEGTEGEQGSGLGLILTKEFVAKHNGRIWIESELGKGTTFYFTLPAAVAN